MLFGGYGCLIGCLGLIFIVPILWVVQILLEIFLENRGIK